MGKKESDGELYKVACLKIINGANGFDKIKVKKTPARIIHRQPCWVVETP